jgi:la-related protein 1
MAQDFYLRQQMNPEGWISIPLLASFNRIRQLTPDPQLVRDVLTLSSVVEVSGDWTRMTGNQWAQFVLPPPTPSAHQPTPPETTTTQESVEEDGNVEEEDEDDVEFVITQERGNPSWTSERHPL